MRVRPSPLAAAAAASMLALLLVPFAPGARAEDGEAPPAAAPSENVKNDADHDFEWKVPEKWEFQDVSEEDQAAGYVAKARRVVSVGMEITAWVLVKDATGLSIEEATKLVKENKTKPLKDVKVESAPVAWAGSQSAQGMRIVGKASNDSTIVWFCRSTIANGKYHELDVRATNLAHVELQGEIDAAIGSYRILSVPQPEAGAAPTAESARFTKKFAKLGLSWTLPAGGHKEIPAPKEGDPARVLDWGFTADGNPDLGYFADGLVAEAVLQSGDDVKMVWRLILPKVKTADLPPSEIVKVEDNFEGEAQNFDGAPIPKTDGDVKVGNAKGAYHQFMGKGKQGKALFIRNYYVTLKKQLYLVMVVAYEGYETKELEWYKATLDGFRWEDASTGIRGPVVAPFVSAAEPRGDWTDIGKEKKVIGSVSFTKPAAFGGLKTEGRQGWVFAGEARKPNAYLFVGISRFDPKTFLQSKDRKDPDSQIDDHEGEWKNAVEDAVTKLKGGKANKKPDMFRGAKGSSYVFTGKQAGVPFVERGWIVVAKGNGYWIRAQFAGADAENVLGAEWKDFQSSIKFD